MGGWDRRPPSILLALPTERMILSSCARISLMPFGLGFVIFFGNFIDLEVREEFIHTVAPGYWETCDVGNIWKVFGKYLLL